MIVNPGELFRRDGCRFGGVSTETVDAILLDSSGSNKRKMEEEKEIEELHDS